MVKVRHVFPDSRGGYHDSVSICYMEGVNPLV
jgi:hypothetical protein